MQVDWAGRDISYYGSVTGEEYKAYLFVAASPCCNYIYVEACVCEHEAGELRFKRPYENGI